MRTAVTLLTCLMATTTFAQELEGWVTLSGSWSFDDGAMTSSDANEVARYARNAPLHDFTLAFEYRAESESDAKGAVLVRSHWLPSEADLKTGHLYGYRFDIAADPKATGAVTETYSDTQLVTPSPDATAAIKPGDWNRVTIVGRGDVLHVWINDVKATHVTDEAFIAGHIAFVSGAGSGMAFRNVEVTEHPRHGEWRSLFNGENLDGWKVYGSERFDVEDGTIIGRSGPKKSEGYLLTDESFTDFRVKGQFKMLGAGNFGLFYRSKIKLREEDGYPLIAGVQGEVDPKFPGPSGWHYESYRRGWLHEKPQFESMRAYAAPPNRWGEIEIRAIGNRTTSWINGIRIVDFHDDNPQVFEGGFALQLHAGGVDGIQWKELYVLDSVTH